VVSYRKERERLERLLKYIVASLDLDSPKTSYIGVFLIKEHSLAWIAHVKQLAALAAQVNNSPKTSYNGVFLINEHSLAWIAHVKQLAALAAQVDNLRHPR
jgi:hypothetical protein